MNRPASPFAPRALLLGVGCLMVASLACIDFHLSRLTAPDTLARLTDFLAGFWPPGMTRPLLWHTAQGLLETLAMALTSTGLASFMSALLAPLALQRRGGLCLAVRQTFNLLRAVPELIFALVLVVAVGLGPFAGTLALMLHTTGVLGRLFSDALENLPRAAYETLRANGATRPQAYLYATLPQALPQYLSYTLYRLENNIRAATILGMVGAGGLGQALFYNLSLFRMHSTATVILAMGLLVLAVDAFSAYCRHLLTR